MQGVFWWDLQLPVPGAGDQTFSMYGKPADTVVLPRWFGANPQTLPVSSDSAH